MMMALSIDQSLKKTSIDLPFKASPCGTPFVPHYRLDPERDTVVIDGEDDLDAMIQAAADSCDLNKIIARFNQTHDLSLFQVRESMFGDFTAAPKSLAEAQQMLINAKHSFESLPNDVRKEFNNSFEEYSAAANDGSLFGRLSKFDKKEAKTDESK